MNTVMAAWRSYQQVQAVISHASYVIVLIVAGGIVLTARGRMVLATSNMECFVMQAHVFYLNLTCSFKLQAVHGVLMTSHKRPIAAAGCQRKSEHVSQYWLQSSCITPA